MTGLKVELLDHMGDDLAVANAARVSMAKESEWDEYEVSGTDGQGAYTDVRKSLRNSDIGLIEYLAKHYHWTPFAHTALKFRITAPIFLARQLFKHKVGLVENEVSRRYVKTVPEAFQPTYWRGVAPEVKQGSSDKRVYHVTQFGSGKTSTPEQLWIEHFNRSVKLYLDLLDAGTCPEQARMVLPLGTMTEWIWTGSVASFARVFKQRIDPHAQREAQDLAKLIGAQVEPLFPVSWKAMTTYD